MFERKPSKSCVSMSSGLKVSDSPWPARLMSKDEQQKRGGFVPVGDLTLDLSGARLSARRRDPPGPLAVATPTTRRRVTGSRTAPSACEGLQVRKDCRHEVVSHLRPSQQKDAEARREESHLRLPHAL